MGYRHYAKRIGGYAVACWIDIADREIGCRFDLMASNSEPDETCGFPMFMLNWSKDWGSLEIGDSLTMLQFIISCPAIFTIRLERGCCSSDCHGEQVTLFPPRYSKYLWDFKGGE